MTPIPLVRVAGSHHAVGRQVGEATARAIERAVERLSEGDVARASGYLEATLRHLPWIVEEFDAAAEAAAVDRLALFAASVEELQTQTTPAPARGCTDLLVEPEATANGHRLVAHSNDLEAREEDDVVAIEWRVDGEPAVFTLGVGPWISVGWNELGLSVTGNELTQTDERVGVPRLLLMRDVVRRRTLQDAVEAALHPARASSYNWVLASPEGAVNVEGSATSSSTRRPQRGWLTHTNHYLDAEMLPFEGDLEYARQSAIRCERAKTLLESAGDEIDVDALRSMLADHESAPGSICRHADSPEETKTVFWCVADVTDRVIRYGRGNPCEAEPQEYAL